MQTLQLKNGDLVLAQGGYALITGQDRIRQDLSLALRDEYGTDRFHPGWGSVIMRYIGNPITPQLEMLVRGEVNRVVQNYILIQKSEVLRDSQVDVKGRFTTSDVVRALRSITVSIKQDTINIVLVLETLARETVTIKRQVAA